MKAPARSANHTAPASAGAFAQGGFGAAFIGLCRRPLLWAGLAVCLLAGYAPALFGGAAVGIDDLAIYIYQQEGEFLRQNRITQWLVQAATGLLTCRPFWPEFWAGIFLAAAGVLLAALLYAAAGQTPGTAGALLLAGGLLLFPYHAEILTYSNQVTVPFGMLLCVLALVLCRTHLAGGWRRGLPGAAGAAVLLAFALGCYESMAQVWLTLVFAFLLTAAQGMPAQSRRAWWAVPAVLRGVWPFAVGLLLRSGLAAAMRAALGVTGENGTSSTTIYWFRRESVDAAVKIFLHQSISCYITRAYMVPAAALLLGACVLLALWVGFRWRGNGSWLFAFGLLVSQFALGILQGTGSQKVRTCQCFALFVPFVAWLWLRDALPAGHAGRRCPAVWVGTLLAAALLAVEGAGLNCGFAADRARWQYEQTLLRDVAARLDELDPGGTQPVVFTGEVTLPDEVLHTVPLEKRPYAVERWMQERWNFPVNYLYPYEEVTQSVINWAQTAFGSHEQMYLLMDWIGRPCTRAVPDQQAAGNILSMSLGPGTVTAQDGYLLVHF